MIIYFVTLIFQVCFAWIYSLVLEYFIHSVLHDNREYPFFFKNHFGRHHNEARKNKMYDKNYENFFSKTSLFEVLGLLLLAILHLPFAYFFPIGYLSLLVSLVHYYYIHRKSHLNPDWAKKHLKWHYDHHMGTNQHANWGIRTEYFDIKFETRIKYRYLKRGKK